MAIASNGILGPLSGKVGTVTGYMRNGIPVLRIATRKKDNVQSPARKAQRGKLKLCSDFTRAFAGTDFFKKTFPAYGHTGTGLHRATSAIMNLAITGAYPALSLAYPLVLISKGPLPGAAGASASLLSAQQIGFTWQDNSNTGTASPNDAAIVVAYGIEAKQVLFSLDAAYRSSQTATFNIPAMQPQQIATWLSFINAQGDVADSVFCGLFDNR